MGLFRKGEAGSATGSATVDKLAISSILDKSMSITGDVIFSGKARVDGRIEGNVKGEYLILSESGAIRGDIEVTVMVCQGQVDGNIQAETLHAQQAARINGCLHAVNLTVDSGALLNGEIKARSQDLPLDRGTNSETEEEVGANSLARN